MVHNNNVFVKMFRFPSHADTSVGKRENIFKERDIDKPQELRKTFFGEGFRQFLLLL